MSKEEYYAFLNSDLDEENFEKVYTTPKVIVSSKGERKILEKRLESFFEFDRDINRAQNIQKAYEYGYTKAHIANFLGLSPAAVARYTK